MDGLLLIGLLMFKHVLILLLLFCFVFVQTLCTVWLCFRTTICINRYSGWNILNIFLYLKKKLKMEGRLLINTEAQSVDIV